jgi:ATP/maltotriose-dependent transcriptional regulator MalT
MSRDARIDRTRRLKRDLQAAAASMLPSVIAIPVQADPEPPGVVFPVPLETKLQPPSVRGEWLERKDLIRHLAGITAKLILVGAPAGFGKTSLVAQWRASSAESTRFAWLSLDRGDNDPVRLWWHVIGALHRACPELGDGSALRLPRAVMPDLGATLLPALVNRLATLRDPVVLILDDYHVIKERECHEQIEFLLLRMPRSVQVVLVTRADPPLALGRLRAAGDMAEIRVPELRFTPADVASLVLTIAGVRLGEQDVADLVARTEGWPAGVYLAALSLRGNPSPSSFIRQFTGNNRFIVDFLAEEVLDRQPPRIRQFLLRTSVLERFTAPLCEAVTGISDAADVIDRLEQDNLFLVPLDDDRLWYRYHHLFAQMLRSQLARAEPELIPALHERASTWHRERGRAEEAIAHALAAADVPGAVNLIASHWYTLVDSGRTATIRDWIRSLGDDAVADDPVAAHCAAWVAALCGDRGSVSRWLEVVEAGQHDGPLPDGMRSLKSSAALLRGAFGFDSVRVMRESAATATELERDPMTRWYALARAAFGFSLYISEEPGAAAVLDQALLADGALPLTRMMALAVASLVAVDEGRLTQAQKLANAARQIVVGGDIDDSPQSTFVLTALGAVNHRQQRLTAARHEFERAIRLRQQLFEVSPWPAIDTHLRLAAVLLDLDDRPAAAESLAMAGHVLTATPEGAEALRARLSRLERRLAGASWGTPLAEALTEREETVLHLLRGSLTLREIGRELYLSGNTIKTHTRAIYRKLGVRTRHDAVERARETGILL